MSEEGEATTLLSAEASGASWVSMVGTPSEPALEVSDGRRRANLSTVSVEDLSAAVSGVIVLAFELPEAWRLPSVDDSPEKETPESLVTL